MFRRLLTLWAKPILIEIHPALKNSHLSQLRLYSSKGSVPIFQPQYGSRKERFPKDSLIGAPKPAVKNRIVQLSRSLAIAPKGAKVQEQEEYIEPEVVFDPDTKTGKKRPKRRSQIDPKFDMKHSYPVCAYATCEELDLERLHGGLIHQDLYIPTILSEDMDDVIHVSAKYKISDEPREIFFFRDGAVVFWNMPELECLNVLKFLTKYEHESYDTDQVTEELEYMRYSYHDQGLSRLSKGRIVLFMGSANQTLEKYAFANAMASSVKLGIWESTLDNFVDSIADITEVLKRAEKLTLSREEVLQKTGELYSLRHELNLNSDLLDTPDFYWERERLEDIYQKTCNYLNMGRRTKVLNEKMAQCSELLELISTHLTDRHHTRLELMIIILIMIEVGFEILHVAERYFM